MSEDAQYHETRAAQEMAIGLSCTVDEARKRHMELAERHADMARLIRGKNAADGSLTAISSSREVSLPGFRARSDHHAAQPLS